MHIEPWMKALRIVSFLIMGFVIVGCVEEEPIQEFGSDYTVYFANNELTGHVPVYVDLESEESVEQVYEILNLLKDGLDNPSIKTTLPKEVEILEVKIQGNQAILNFSRDYTNMSSPIIEIICRSSIVKSITDLEAIDTVSLLIEGIPLKDSEGNVIGAMNNNDIIMDLKDEDLSTEETELIIYFANEEATKLVKVRETVVIDGDLGYEQTIMNLLIEGPEQSDLFGTIPEDTIVKDIYTNDGTCYVDLNEAFITSHGGGSSGETMTIYSIVNSLAERPNIRKVQFLIEGEIKDTYKGHYEFDLAFEPDWDIVE